jgi:D-alanyl-D-alanine carboxypeptidase
VSALSGYVRTSEGSLVAFSVLSRGLSKSAAVAIEDAIVRTIALARLR